MFKIGPTEPEGSRAIGHSHTGAWRISASQSNSTSLVVPALGLQELQCRAIPVVELEAVEPMNVNMDAFPNSSRFQTRW